jgi:hypothetical protein
MKLELPGYLLRQSVFEYPGLRLAVENTNLDYVWHQETTDPVRLRLRRQILGNKDFAAGEVASGPSRPTGVPVIVSSGADSPLLPESPSL